MKNTRSLVMAVVATSVLALGAGFAQAARPAITPAAPAVPRTSDESYAISMEARAKSDARAAGHSIAAAARYVRNEASSAGQATEADTANALRAAESFSEKLVNRMKTGTERAWSTTTDAVRRAVARIG